MKFSVRCWKTWLICFTVTLSAIIATSFAYFPDAILTEMGDRSLRSLGMEVKELWIDGSRIHYVEGGSGQETVLLVHGFRSNMNYWSPYLPELLKQYHVIALDLPGHGGSSRPIAQKYDMVSMGRSLATFVEVKGLNNFHIVACSMGGGISLCFANEHPQRLKKLALINPLAIRPPHKSEVQEALDQGDNLLLPKDAVGFVRMQQLVYGAKLPLNPILSKLILNSLVKDRDFYMFAFNQMVQAGGIESLLPHVATPTLLIQSDRDRVVDASSAAIIEKLMPQTQLVWIVGGAHTLRGDDRQVALDAILEFLKSNHELPQASSAL